METEATSTTLKNAAKPLTFAEMPVGYAGLVALHPPRLIESKIAATATRKILITLAGHSLSADQVAYAKLLTHLLAEWKREHEQPANRAKPHELVAAMMMEHDLTQAAMAKVLGITQRHVSRILRGERALSEESIVRFAERFSIDVAKLL